MKNKLLSLALCLGLMIFIAYFIANQFIEISDIVAHILMIMSEILMGIGLINAGYCFGKRITSSHKQK